MVKIPNLDELKKMGSGLVGSAKSINVSGIVDKIKSGVEAASVGKKETLPVGDEGLKKTFEELYGSLNELLQLQVAEVNATKKIQAQLSLLADVINANQNQENKS